MSKKQFSAGGLNALGQAVEDISEAVERASQAPLYGGAVVKTGTAPAGDKPVETIGVNLLLSIDTYKKLQALRMERGKVPMRKLIAQIVDEYVDRMR